MTHRSIVNLKCCIQDGKDEITYIISPCKEDKVAILEFAVKTLLANQGYQALSLNFGLYVNDPKESKLMESGEEISNSDRSITKCCSSLVHSDGIEYHKLKNVSELYGLILPIYIEQYVASQAYHASVFSTLQMGTRCHMYITDCNGNTLEDEGYKDCSLNTGNCEVGWNDQNGPYCVHMQVEGHIGSNNRYLQSNKDDCFHVSGNVFKWDWEIISDCKSYVNDHIKELDGSNNCNCMVGCGKFWECVKDPVGNPNNCE
ncbi:9394_t:CDS:2 [Gigaspora margarita]|uniref:9394_t:CDS:1 n=1 Tax=Gigaspora margarita TaxID=4874 RepID=A0ABM8VWI5_GIGMA|nr:9394_t:CDS:2 [Gigaspora margarita]